MFTQSSFYENKVLSRNISQLTLGEIPCFHKIKMVNNNEWNLQIFFFSQSLGWARWGGDQNLGAQLTVNPMQRGRGGGRLCPPHYCFYEIHLCIGKS